MAFDVNLVMYTSGSLTLAATATGDEVDFGGPDLMPMCYTMEVPMCASGSATITGVIQGSDTSGSASKVTFANFPVVDSAGMSSTSGSQVFVTARTPYRYRRVVLTLSDTAVFGSTTQPVTVNPDLAGRYTEF